MHELSNDGARAQFDKLINKVLLPVMVDCAKVGGAVGGAAPHCSANVHDTLPVRSVIGRMCWCGCVDAIEREECSVSVFVDHLPFHLQHCSLCLVADCWLQRLIEPHSCLLPFILSYAICSWMT